MENKFFFILIRNDVFLHSNISSYFNHRDWHRHHGLVDRVECRRDYGAQDECDDEGVSAVARQELVVHHADLGKEE